MLSLSCDVLMIGAGGAGLQAAARAAEAGLSVLVLSKVPPLRSHTVAAQGGINAALGNRLADDWRWHAYDTLKGSDWLADADAVEVLCSQAAEAMVALEHLGMAFSRDALGNIYQRAYGGQYTDFGRGGTAYRACAVADRTGHALLYALHGAAVRAGVQVLAECVALDLFMDAQHGCLGALAWQLETGELLAIRAQRTILATGGFGQAFAATTASSICTGDGGGMALRAGLPLQDMEFVQFHPTGLYGAGVLITEGARGEGACLLNRAGERFMARYAPGAMELASRDIIARAIATEIAEGRGCGDKHDHVLLSLTHMPASIVQQMLPSVLHVARTFGRIDATRTPIPVVPTVHFTMGGVAADAACNAVDVAGTPVPGLLVVGEAACSSVHGANRLGCNSLLDLVVFGTRAGQRCAEELTAGASLPALPSLALEVARTRLEKARCAKGGTTARTIRRTMQQVMQHHAGIFRHAASLAEGAATLRALHAQWQQDMRLVDRSLVWNTELLEALETENLLLQARACMESALFRTESRGAHWREDFPARDDAHWRTHTLANIHASGDVVLGTRPVRTYSGEAPFPQHPIAS